MTDEDLKKLYELTKKSKADRDLAHKLYPSKQRSKSKGGLVRYNPETDTYDCI